MMKHESYHLHDHSIISFSHVIEFREIWYYDLIFDILILQIILQNILIFYVIVNMNDLNIFHKFHLCKIFKYLKDFKNNAYFLVWYKKIMYESNYIINEYNEIFVSIEWGDLHWFIYIKMNQHSLFWMLVVNERKRWFIYLSHHIINIHIHIMSILLWVSENFQSLDIFANNEYDYNRINSMIISFILYA